jgi:hypothetical protein
MWSAPWLYEPETDLRPFGFAVYVRCDPYGVLVTDDDDDFTPWTSQGAARLRAAAAELAAAVVAHADAVATVTSHARIQEVYAASEGLLPAVLAYADAQFDYTGTGFPFGVLHQFADDDEDGDEEGEEVPTAGVTVLQRRDYRVTNEAAVMDAGRRAYLRVWPDDDDAAAAADVTHLGRALYQLAHADGWHSLDQVEGLRTTGGAVVVLQQEELLGPDPDEWPEELFDDDAQVLYSQQDVFGW